SNVENDKLFDRFYTVENARGSSGLGLSIARELTEKMGGTIRSEINEGVLSIILIFNN
ncbi:MAG: ATP-binding protein, partial [Phocaeicola sp.]